MAPSPKIIGEWLKKLRLKHPELSQEEAGKLVGVSSRTWMRWESGKGVSVPDIVTLDKLADARGEELLTLFGAIPLVQRANEIPIVDRIPAGTLTQGFGDGGVIGYVDSDIADPNAFALIVTGTSMWPEIQEEDIVICSPAEPFINGKIYATVIGEGEQSLKRVRRDQRSKAYALIPSNKEFPTVYVPEEQMLRLVRVVEVRRDLQ